MNLSIWEKNSFSSYDVIIVGAGITGLSTAASIKERKPELRVVVIERGILPTGASTKNAGFACFGSVSELMEDHKQMGAVAMAELVQMRWDGLLKTRNRLSDKNTGYEQLGGYELLFEENDPILNHIRTVNASLQHLFGKDVYHDHSSQLPCFHFGTGVKHLIKNELEGQLDSGQLISSLWEYCMQLGVRILTGSRVTLAQKNRVVINGSLALNAGAVVLCTNAFTRELAPIALKPGRGMVMAIKPKRPLSFRGTFHYEKGYYYFRNYHDLLIIGGGRNLDFDGEETTFFGINEQIKSKLRSDVASFILPENPYEIVSEWSGIMAFGDSRQPVIEENEEGLFVGARLGGMGVAIGSMVGDKLAEMIIGARF